MIIQSTASSRRRKAMIYETFFAMLVALGAAGCGEGGSGDVELPPGCLAAAEPFGSDPAKGESFPDIELTACDGSVTSTAALRCQSKVTLFAVGAGWCGPCNEEAPDLEKAYQELLDEDIGVVQVMVQDVMVNPATTLFCQKWVDTFDLTMPVYIDPAGKTLGTTDTMLMPLNVIVDRNGRALRTVIGGKLGDVTATLRAEAGSIQ
ncbi:MAG: TlpA family protein disulfide reductase [Polyangiaceae bacterium]|nr:TlpA family protein disulfide reductase [Polyangiaceae bacterium]